MRKVEKQIKEAWEAGKSLTVGNTRTDGETIYLFGHAIIHREQDGRIRFTLAGWDTVTTRSRLKIIGAGVYHEKHVPKRNGREIPTDAWQWL